jgi:hypothetical protein
MRNIARLARMASALALHRKTRILELLNLYLRRWRGYSYLGIIHQ